MNAAPGHNDKTIIRSAAGGPLYQLADGVKGDDIQSTLSAKLSQLHAMLATCYGAGYESFSSYSEAIQDNYLWACSSLAEECKCLAKRL